MSRTDSRIMPISPMGSTTHARDGHDTKNNLPLLAQMVVLREILVASFAVELIYLLSFGVWLFFSTLGAHFAGKIKNSLSEKEWQPFLPLQVLPVC